MAWIGFHEEGVLALESLLAAGYPIVAVVTLCAEEAAKRSAAVDYKSCCRQRNIPVYEVVNINDAFSQQLLLSLDLDLALVIGWSQILRETTLRCFRIGAIGAHASLLPHNRGRAPINWALINGEKQTGNTLIWLTSGADADVDNGGVIDQRPIPITPFDTCATLYRKVAESNRDMLLSTLPALLEGKRPGLPQPQPVEPLLPGRTPARGAIDWTQSAERVYNFIRAQTHPYPGAFGFLDGECWTVWKAALLPGELSATSRAGVITGPLVSPVAAACGQIVSCATGFLALLELEKRPAGTTLKGRVLASRDWTGMEWTNASKTSARDHGASGRRGFGVRSDTGFARPAGR